jgi:hypothetical protein
MVNFSGKQKGNFERLEYRQGNRGFPSSAAAMKIRIRKLSPGIDPFEVV